MNELYRDYPRAIQEELESLRDREVEEGKPKKQGLSLWKRLKSRFTLLLKKAAK